MIVSGLQRALVPSGFFHSTQPSLGSDLRLGIRFLSVGAHPPALETILEPARDLLARRDVAPVLFPIAELIVEGSDSPTDLDWEAYHRSLSSAFADELRPSFSSDLDIISGSSDPHFDAIFKEVELADVQTAKELGLLSPQTADDFLDILAAPPARLLQRSGAYFVGDDLGLLAAFRQASRLSAIRRLLPAIFEIFERRSFSEIVHPIADLYDAPRPEDWRAYRNRILDSAVSFLRPQFDVEIQDAFAGRLFFWTDDAKLAQRRRTSLSRASYLAYYSAGLIMNQSSRFPTSSTISPLGGCSA